MPKDLGLRSTQCLPFVEEQSKDRLFWRFNSRKSTLNFQREQGQDRVNENEASDWTGEKLLAHHT